MCGISGIFNFQNKSYNFSPIIKRMVNKQNNRGPDNSGFWNSSCNKVFLGHNRLSIIDLSANGNQPMISYENEFVITFNGEIYNFKEIKIELINLGVKFSNNTDTEVLLESYKHWGINSLSKLRGMYAFSIWDLKKKTLLLVRDPFGIKPLYYTYKNNVFYFASEVKTITSATNLSFKKSLNGLMDYYNWGNIQGTNTIFEDIYSLKAGSYKLIDCSGKETNGTFADIKESILNSKEMYFENKIDASLYLKDIIDETVRYHQVSDVPITLMLSSGLDSSILASSMNNNTNNKSLTMEFSNSEIKTNENYLAKKTAAINNLKHSLETVSLDQINKLLNDFFINMDLPTNDGLNTYLISNFAKLNNSKVLISGIGGDELFSGYPSFKRIPVINKIFDKLPYFKSLNNLFKNQLYDYLKKFKLNTKYSNLYAHGKNLEKTFFWQRSLFIENEIKEIFSDQEFKREMYNLDLYENLANDIKYIENPKLCIMFLELKYYLQTKLLRDSDWTSMSNSIELRTPLIDWTFFQKLMPLLKSNIFIDKKFLFNTYKKYLPNEILKRKKTGFSVPYRDIQKKTFQVESKYKRSIKDWSLLSIKKYSELNQI